MVEGSVVKEKTEVCTQTYSNNHRHTMDTLTQEEQELVREFVSIANYTQPPHTAIPYLQAADWNLERAILIYFEGNAAASEQLNENSRRYVGSVVPGAFPGDDSMEQYTRSRGIFHTMRAKLAQYWPLVIDPSPTTGFTALSARSKGVYAFQLILYIPLVILQKTTLIVFLVMAKVFPLMKRLTTRYARQGSRSEPKAVDPSHIARNFIADFNTFYRNDDKLDFLESGYTVALHLAKRDARFLMVYLHSDEHDDTNGFVNGTLLNPLVLDFVNQHNLLVWGGNVLESEAYQVSNAVGASKFPFVGLLSLKSSTQETPEGTTTSTPTLAVVARVQGPVSPEKLLDKFASQVERLEPTLITLRSERQQQDLSRVIREQQDRAYQESLDRDRELAEQRRLEGLERQNKEQWLRWRALQIIPELDPNSKGEYARIAVRLASGERISRRFSKDATLEEIFAYVELYQRGLLDAAAATTTTQVIHKPENFQYAFSFRLVSPMPRAELSPSNTRIQDEPSVWPNGNLIVESTS